MSIENPYKSPETVSPGSDAPKDRDRLRRIARAQRQVNLAVLLYLAIIPVNLALGAVGGGAPWVSVVLGLFVLIILGLGATSVYKLASIFRGNVVAVVYVLGLLVPLLGLLLLLSISGKATKELREAGIKVGLLGADPNAV
jgi:asparagine N-glycosylation enzyme membrane subunit Stt3